MAFTTYAVELQKLRDAMSAMTAAELIQSGYTNGEGQTVTFRKWADVTDREEWLIAKASEEANTGGRRKTMIVMGAGGVG